MTTAFELAFQQALARKTIGINGETVTYSASDAVSKTINALVDRGSGRFPGEFEVTISDSAIEVRILKEDVATPRRGDQITDAEGQVYIVDAVDALDAVEWVLLVRPCDG